MEFSTMTPVLMHDHNINSAQKNIVGAPYTDDTQNANEKQSVQNTCDNNTTAADISQVAVADSGKFSGVRTLAQNNFLPMATTPDFNAIPQMMKDLPRWLCWQLTPNKDKPKPSKIPMTIQSGRLVYAAVNKPENWLTFDEAISYYNRGECSGIGFALTNTPPQLCCIDIDGCINPDGTLTYEAQATIKICANSWTELSQSGNGIHLWFIDEEFFGGRKNPELGIELYAEDRYIAMTGRHLDGTGTEIKTANGACRNVIKEFFDDREENIFDREPAQVPNSDIDSTETPAPLSDTDRELIKYFRSEQCRLHDLNMFDLFNGNTAEYFKNTGKNHDDSGADIVLMLKILYYTGNTGTDDQIKHRALNIFGQSELAKRDKWTSREDYRLRTINAAFSKWTENGRNTRAINANTTVTHNEPQEVLDEIFKGAGDDLRNGERIAIYGQDKIRWLVDDEKWLLYNDGIWQRRSGLNSCVMPMVKQMAAVLAKNANSKQQQAIADIFRKQKKVNAALFFLKGCREILIEAKDLNRHKNLIAVQNGVIDLETGKHYDLSPDFLITNQIAATYDPAADISFIENFFAEVLPDVETCRAVLRYIGYALTGEKNYHISEFWRGSGANGKSTILDVLIKFFATYAVKLPSLALLESKRPVDGNTATPAIAQLDGDKRLAIIDELPRNARLDAALYKTITGDETVSARALYCNPRDIELRAKLILNGNHLPTFDVDDGGLQRRITNVEFTQKFEGDRADPDLPKKLTTPANRSAFLKILVAEAQNFYRDGLIESNAMKDAKFAYFAESDFIADFISEHCIIGDGGEVLRKTLEEKISSIYPRDCARLKKKELFRIIAEKLETAGAIYTQDGHKHNIFKNVKLIDVD